MKSNCSNFLKVMLITPILAALSGCANEPIKESAQPQTAWICDEWSKQEGWQCREYGSELPERLAAAPSNQARQPLQVARSNQYTAQSEQEQSQPFQDQQTRSPSQEPPVRNPSVVGSSATTSSNDRAIEESASGHQDSASQDVTSPDGETVDDVPLAAESNHDPSRRWLEESGYTIQLAASADRQSLIKRKQSFEDERAIIRIWSSDAIWYVLVHGVYPSRDEALYAASDLQLQASPWIRSLSSLQSAHRQAEGQ